MTVTGTGTVTGYPGDSMVVSMGDSRSAVFPVRRIARVDTSLGVPGGGSPLGLVGLLVGAAAGAAIGAATSEGDVGASRIVGIGLLSGAVGLGAGTHLAKQRSSEQWIGRWFPQREYADAEAARPSVEPQAERPGPAVEAGVRDFYVPAGPLRARVTTGGATGGPFVGQFLGARDDTLTIASGRQALDIPWEEISQVEIRYGWSRSTGRGALIGLLAGGAVGAAMGAASEDQSTGFLDLSKGAQIAAGAVTFGLLGAGIGAIAGHSIVHEKWEAVPLDRVGVGPAGGVWIPAPGDLQVRVTAPGWMPGSPRGVEVARVADSLSFVHDGQRIGIPLAHVSKIEATWSKESRGSVGALIGYACGFAVGAAGAQVEPDRARVGLLAGLPGAFLGMLIGKQFKAQRWEEVPIEEPPLQFRSAGDWHTSPGAGPERTAGEGVQIER